MSHYILLVDFGSTYSKFTLVEMNPLRIRDRLSLPTTVESSIMDCYREGKERILQGVSMKTEDKLEEYFCSSAWGGYRMVVIGFTASLTQEAGQRAALGAGTRIIKNYHYSLSQEDVEEIQDLHPDAILLCGGTNGGNQTFVMEVAQLLADNLDDIEIIYAGNNRAQDQVKEIFRASPCPLYIADNVMPAANTLEVDSVRHIARQVFMKKIAKAKGLNQLMTHSKMEVIPTPAAVLQATKLWGQAHIENDRRQGSLVVDIGGATTDVHSYGDGFPNQVGVAYEGLFEPTLKRTVEGDLGMRISAEALYDLVGAQALMDLVDGTIDSDDIAHAIRQRSDHPSFIALSDLDKDIDKAIAYQATRISVDRHVGHLEKISSQTYLQFGKDMRDFDYLIGTGGVLVYNDDPKAVLGAALNQGGLDLKPSHPQLVLDKDYLLSILGLLSMTYPRQALTLMENHLEMI